MKRETVRTQHISAALDLSEADITNWLSSNPEYRPKNQDDNGWIWTGAEIERFNSAYLKQITSERRGKSKSRRRSRYNDGMVNLEISISPEAYENLIVAAANKKVHFMIYLADLLAGES